eukprot:TRINITY_DN1463_c1_g2_i1.p1 TRINITY_DN1463_c1_g2~~TRINITY_DN1463_c1_g2_i1.p1  ORF type:complete len:332 (+),score=100.01 TRINITY_DN1463_c1_g2_i1:45-1040(+)
MSQKRSNLIESYRKKCRKEAMQIIDEVMPKKVLEISKLLKTDKYLSVRTPPENDFLPTSEEVIEYNEKNKLANGSISKELKAEEEQKKKTKKSITKTIKDTQIAEEEKKVENENENTESVEPPSKKRKVDLQAEDEDEGSEEEVPSAMQEHSSNCGCCDDDDDEDDDNGKISAIAGTFETDLEGKCNPVIKELIAVMRKWVSGVIEDTGKIKQWISLNIPQFEDGNNFGVTVQNQAIEELSSFEDSCYQCLGSIQTYYASRARLYGRFYRKPLIADYREALKEHDSVKFTNIRLTLADIRNNYATILDFLTKNLQKIKNPKGNSHSSYSMF